MATETNVGADADASASADAGRPEPDRVSVTEVGGLLFLLHVARDIDLPGRIAADARLAQRPVAPVCHRLGISLADVGERDPAALAFAGWPTDRDPPPEAPPWSEDELQAVADLRAAVVDGLAARLAAAAIEPPAEPLAWVVRRRAEIVTDAGWIEARFALDTVSTEIRRAGLDLHPDWIPWLGVIVRLVYV